MKKIFLAPIILITLLLTPASAFAQGMMNWISTPSGAQSDNHTAREEEEGKEVWEKLQAKEITCENLSDDNFGVLGEYFMGQMVGDSHEAMNTMMERMMGKEGEEQMHVVIGKKMSGCDTGTKGGGNPAPALSGVEGMGTGWGNMMGSTSSPQVGGWNGFGILGWIPMLLFWILLILGVVALFRYLGGSTRSGDKERLPLDILKERYAKGEIDKKEFEQMKKDLI